MATSTGRFGYAGMAAQPTAHTTADTAIASAAGFNRLLFCASAVSAPAMASPKKLIRKSIPQGPVIEVICNSVGWFACVCARLPHTNPKVPSDRSHCIVVHAAGTAMYPHHPILRGIIPAATAANAAIKAASRMTTSAQGR